MDYAWQLTETLEDFFSRLAPATTDQTVDVPWIFICNPYVSREKNDEVGEFMKGNEDEAPTEKGSQLRLVVQGGTERLELLAELKKKLELSGKSASFVAKELSQEQKRAIADVLGLAHAGKVRTGKVRRNSCHPSGHSILASVHDSLDLLPCANLIIIIFLTL